MMFSFKRMYKIGWVFMFLIHCQKNPPAETTISQKLPERAPYDTTARDSFAPGAVPEHIYQNIRMNSKAYRDSVQKSLAEKEKITSEQKSRDSLGKIESQKKNTEKKNTESTQPQDQ